MASLRTPQACCRVLEYHWLNCATKLSHCAERGVTSIQEQPVTTNCQKSSNLTRKNYSESSRNRDTKQSENFLVQQLRNVGRIKDGVSNIMSGFVTLSVEQPGKWLSDYHKYLPFSIKVKTTVSEVEDHHLQPKEIKEINKIERSQAISESEQLDRERHNLLKHVQNTNYGIDSFYDVLPTQNNNLSEQKGMNVNNNSQVHTSKQHVEEEFSMLKLLVNKAALLGLHTADTAEKKPVIRKDFVSRTALTSRTRALVYALKLATSNISKLKRAEDLSNHLLMYPECRAHAVKEKVLPCLLLMSKSRDWAVCGQGKELLSLVGYVSPVGGQGIRVLTIDGGGTRGLNAIESLKKLEEACKTEIYKLFDYVCGSSTGALIVAMVFLHRVSLNDTEELYKEFSSQMFTRNRFVGTGKLMWNHAFYDTEQWEKILKNNIGENPLIEFARDPLCPKMSAISTMMNLPTLKNYIFRNYNLPPGVFSHYSGNCKHKIWEVIRASSAAPGYYEEFRLGDFIHQDGGLLTNNPTALAIHECKLLWPNESLQCVVSLGTGRYEPNLTFYPSKSSLKDKVNKIVDSATDTEAVHVTLQDMLPPSVYYRFNPYLAEEFLLDEIRSEKVKKMQHESQMYLRKNEHKIEKAAQQILLPRKNYQKALDWTKLKTDML